jgi:uncharacterized membrane protein
VAGHLSRVFLAWIPLGLSLVLSRHAGAGAEERRSRLGPLGSLGFWALGALWLLFFPNAPYIVTDLIHLRDRSPVPIWFDAVMLFSFALTGLCLAFVSLLLFHRIVERRRGTPAGWIVVVVVSCLTGFGVYLGRYPRWNSWDLVARLQRRVHSRSRRSENISRSRTRKALEAQDLLDRCRISSSSRRHHERTLSHPHVNAFPG